MGTRSLTVFKDEEGKEIVTMYRQMDGYPKGGHGEDLAKFLSGLMIVNGITMEHPERIANGMGCLTAQVVAHFKDGVGSIYLYPPKTRDCWEEYIYEVSGMPGKEPNMCIYEIHSKRKNIKLFEGNATDALKWIEKQE